MPASKIRSDHDALKSLASKFGQQAEASRQMLSNLKSKIDTLRGKDWIGKGADKFYAEMDSAVFPSLTRLSKSMESAQKITLKISQVMKQADDDVAALFRGGLATGGAAGGTAGGAAPGNGTGAVEASLTGVYAGPVLRVGPGGVPVFPGNSGRPPPGNTPTQRVLRDFDPQVAQLADKSPTLKAELDQLEKDGWRVTWKSGGKSYYTDHATKDIYLDHSASTAEIVGQLAHESGHATYGDTAIQPRPGMTRDQFVKANVDAAMRSEGVAQLNAAKVRDEVIAAGGADPGIPGTQTAAYQKVYDDFKAHNITRDQAITRMSTLMNNEVPSGATKKYREDYADNFGQWWDDHVPATGPEP